MGYCSIGEVATPKSAMVFERLSWYKFQQGKIAYRTPVRRTTHDVRNQPVCADKLREKRRLAEEG